LSEAIGHRQDATQEATKDNSIWLPGVKWNGFLGYDYLTRFYIAHSGHFFGPTVAQPTKRLSVLQWRAI